MAAPGLPLLSALQLSPLLATAAVLAANGAGGARRAAWAGALVALALSVVLLMTFDSHRPGAQWVESYQGFGLRYQVGVDGFNVLFLPLTALTTVLLLGCAGSGPLARNRLFIAAIMGYETLLLGAFSTLNLLQFWLWSALELLPVALLATGGHGRRLAGLCLQFWGGGVALTLAGFLFLAFGLVGDDHDLTFSWQTLKDNTAYLHDETLVFILLLFGFAIRMPLFPFHAWLPLLASRAGALGGLVFLAGLQLGLYGLLRFVLPLLPGVAEAWAGFVMALALTSVVYGALLAALQINLYRLLAFAAISQAGLLVAGAFCFNGQGLKGALLLAWLYGLANAALLCCAGLVGRHGGSALLPRLGGLLDRHPLLAIVFLLAALATAAMPGGPGFAAARLLWQGVLDEYGWPVAIALLAGNYLAMLALLWGFKQVFINHRRRWRPPASGGPPPGRERPIAILWALALLLGPGYYPGPWLALVGHDAAALVRAYPVHGSQGDQHPSAAGDRPPPR